MNQTTFPVKVGVIAGAILLGGGFVYVRAGGRLPGIPQAETAPLPQGNTARTIFPGSKSAAVAPLIAPNATVSRSTKPFASQPSDPKPIVQPVPRTMIMSGSKSLILSEPKYSPLFGVPSAAQQPSPLQALPPAPSPQPSPLQALKKATRQKPAPANSRAAPAQQLAPQR
jgi:hypothetical protein